MSNWFKLNSVRLDQGTTATLDDGEPHLADAMDCLKASKASQAKAFTEIKDKLQEYLEDLLDNEFLDSKIEGVPKKPVSEMLLEFLESRASNTLEFESHCEIELGPQNSTFS